MLPVEDAGKAGEASRPENKASFTVRNRGFLNVLKVVCETTTAGSLVAAMIQGNLRAYIVTSLALIGALLLTWLTPD
ncbi:MAG: hypothetical protein LBT40_17045 [Deltaproteobacteria bacterium]|jgi:hypothetical protein|nr:hypothetical protein [Deltaproteobacteria bacterium]